MLGLVTQAVKANRPQPSNPYTDRLCSTDETHGPHNRAWEGLGVPAQTLARSPTLTSHNRVSKWKIREDWHDHSCCTEWAGNLCDRPTDHLRVPEPRSGRQIACALNQKNLSARAEFVITAFFVQSTVEDVPVLLLKKSKAKKLSPTLAPPSSLEAARTNTALVHGYSMQGSKAQSSKGAPSGPAAAPFCSGSSTGSSGSDSGHSAV